MVYENGVLTKGLSRGDGITGEDILLNLQTISNIPKKIENKNVPKLLKLDVKFLYLKLTFEKLKDKFANPRNAAGGSLRQKNPKLTLKFL